MIDLPPLPSTVRPTAAMIAHLDLHIGAELARQRAGSVIHPGENPHGADPRGGVTSR